MVRRVAAKVGGELKFFDVEHALASVNTSGVVIHLSPVARGDGPFNMDGRQAFSRQIHIRGSITTSVAARLRILLVMARTSTVPTVGTILTTGTTILINQYRNLNNTRDYNVLYDKVFSVDPDNIANLAFTINKRLYHKIQNQISDGVTPEWGHYYLIGVSDNPSTTTAWDFVSRFRYVDN